MRSKLVLAVIDGLKPSMLERAVATGRAPTLRAIMERGAYVDDCVAAFPSVTPTCAATIATGAGPDEHHIPSMNWYWRAERRYVEYGSSFSASRRFGLTRQLTDTVYNMNGTHLSKGVRTVFEVLDDAGVRTAGTTYLMYRGRHRHEVARDTALARVAGTLGAFYGGVALGLGALLCAGSIDDRHATWWYGLPLGLACAGLAQAAARDVFGRVRGRLDPDARAALPVYAEAAALLSAFGTILFPPLAVVVLGFLVWLLIGSRRRAGQKYAGLRILR